MKLVISIFLCISAMLMHAAEEVLWWQVPDTTIVQTSNGAVLISDFDAGWARIKMSDGTYLMSYYTDGSTFDFGSIDIPMTDSTSKENPYQAFTYIPKDPASLSFMVELGNWDSNDTWTSEAISRSYSYQELESYVVSNWSSSGSSSAVAPWVPDSFVVPEPSCGLLMLVGALMLSLKRPRIS